MEVFFVVFDRQKAVVAGIRSYSVIELKFGNYSQCFSIDFCFGIFWSLFVCFRDIFFYNFLVIFITHFIKICRLVSSVLDIRHFKKESFEGIGIFLSK